MNLHFIAIGGSVMHGLALALARNGHQVTGSDDHFYDPAKSRLAEAGLLPATEGWDPARIHPGLDAVILGMHAFDDNPELFRAQELELRVFSFPEFIYHQAQHKQRIVITGSYGKSTVTAMIMHVLEKVGKKFDYLIGAPVPGFDLSVRLSDDAPIIVMEGDEYLASKTDPRPKFLLYQPHMVLINGIAWDHINVFPTEELYVEQFARLIQGMGKAGTIIVNEEDDRLMKLVRAYEQPDTHYVHAFGCPSYRVQNGVFQVKIDGERTDVSVFGRHNMFNIAAAWEVCQLLAVPVEAFRQHIATFQGAGIRLQVLSDSAGRIEIRDYAHAPEKVKASVEATREKYGKASLLACVELHSFSSLNPAFLPRYKGSVAKAEEVIVFVDNAVFERRRMEPLTEAQVQAAFGHSNLRFFTDPAALAEAVAGSSAQVKLYMSSGNFSGALG